MRRSLALLIIPLALSLARARADDITPQTVVAVKHATVFIRVEGADWKGSGSGFVISATKDSALVVTNCHVLAGPEFDRTKLGPAAMLKSVRANKATAIFNGGTKAELAAKAEVLAADRERDLAVIRVTGLKSPPAPIPYADAPAPVETMAIVAFGYPLGDALASGKGAPAVTVSKGSVSSLRLDDEGELVKVQIDAAINPGNSGGPVVDAKGRLVGVVVSGYRGAQGLNFAIPASEVVKMMKGRLDGFTATATKAADGSWGVKTEVGVIDPVAALRGATLYYVVVPPKGERPKPGEALAKLPGAKKLALKLQGGAAAAELKVEKAEGDLFVQAVPDRAGAPATPVQKFSLAIPKDATGEVALGATGAGGPGAGEADAPAGWKEHTATNRTYKVWLPLKCNISQKQRSSGRGAQRITFNSVLATVPDGRVFAVDQVTLTPAPRKAEADELIKLLRDMTVREVPGSSVVQESDARMGRFPGKEFVIQKGAAATRGRAFVIGSSVFFLRVVGTRAQVDADDSTTFLESCRLQVPNRPVVPNPPNPGGQPGAGSAIAGGGPNDAPFTARGPAGGAIIGMEVRLGKVGTAVAVHSIRAVYLVGQEKRMGKWHGSADAKAVTESFKVVGRTGYAVGGLTVKTGPTIHGLSIRFMKVAGGRLDPKDAYDTPWIGNKDAPGPAPVSVGGKGEPALGLVGRTTPLGVSGIGLLYAGVEPRPNPPVPVQPTSPRPGQPRGPRVVGRGDTEFRDGAPAGGLLVGLELGLGKFGPRDVVKALRPVYRVGDKESAGDWYGAEPAAPVKVVAKPGYAVGAASIRTTLGIQGVSLTFMKVKSDGTLDPKESYESEWVGSPPQSGVRVGGDGAAAVGVVVLGNDREATGLGLIYSDASKQEAVWPRGTPSKIQGGWRDPEFREAGPTGSLLVGVEVGVGRFVNNKVVKSVRPIFRAGDKDTAGEWHGPTDANTVKEVEKVAAKPGYAVGAVTVKNGLGTDGLSLTFMKVKADGTLDASDSYESEWIGGMGGGPAQKVDGGGKPVIGLIGKSRADTLTGLGLLHPKK